ncbi:hypothetical protein [Virgibacillus sp. YIM 98842]|jgi:hypothetical protein|nr:hypothetical protein [Virgibacillus sp. YIM 98842]
MKRVALIVLLCGLCFGGGAVTEMASDELQPGPFDENPAGEVIL